MNRLLRVLPLLWLAMLTALPAQLVVQATLPRTTYLPGEVVTMEVSVTNQSGRPVAFGTHDGRSWLSVEVNDVEGRPLSDSSDVVTDPFLLRNGETCAFEVPISAMADLLREGSYRARAKVFYPALDGEFVTDWRRIRVREGAVLWEETIGLPTQAQGEGRHRTFRVIRGRIREFSVLFVDVSEPQRHQKYAVFPLGSFIENTRPKIELDRNAVLHVLFQANPSRFVYLQVDHMGNLIEDRQMSADAGRPRLALGEDGTVSFTGPPALGEAEAAAVGPDGLPVEGAGWGGADTPSVSERPPGLDFAPVE